MREHGFPTLFPAEFCCLASAAEGRKTRIDTTERSKLLGGELDELDEAEPVPWMHVRHVMERDRAPRPTLPEGPVDCLTCSACCRDTADGVVLVSVEDIVRWKREKSNRSERILATLVPGHFSQDGLPSHPNGTCIYLGMAENGNACSIYETRAWSCRALEPGSSQCLSYRRRYFAPT